MLISSFKKELSSSLLTYMLVGLSGGFLVTFGYFSFTQKTSSFELSFTEYSKVLGVDAGSVIPASCNSSPPTNHFGGDCPPAVETTISNRFNTLSLNLSSVNPGPTGYYSNGVYYVYNSATVNYSSGGGTTRCAYSSPGFTQWIPTSGAVTIGGTYATVTRWDFSCTDGVYWTPFQYVYIYNMTPPYSTVYDTP